METVKAYFMYRDSITIALELFVFAAAVALTVMHAVLKRKNKSLKLWRVLCCAPLCLCVLHGVLCRYNGCSEIALILYGATYFESLVLAVWQFLYAKKHGYRIFAVFANALAIISLLLSVLMSGIYPSVGNYTNKNYKEAFLSSAERMENEYALSDWKEIDYDALQDKVLPMVEEARKNNDKTAYYIALLNYCYYFYDGHVCVETVNEYGEECVDEAKERLAGNDYGFSMFRLDNGKTVAILVDENSRAYASGIREGTQITKWNGVPIDDAIDETECIYPQLSFPVEENENYLKPMFLAGKGEDGAEVTFVNESTNKKQTVTLYSEQPYSERLDRAIEMFYHKPEDPLSDNYDSKMLSDDCGYLKICSEIPDETQISADSLLTGEYPQIYDMLESKVEKLHNEGMTKLIIDIRNNVGGSDIISETIVSLFADGKYFGHANGEYINGEYISYDERYIEGNGKWSDIDVVVLVNSECGSAGDNLAYNFSKLPNVTVMGITTSQGMDQSTGGMCVLSEGLFSVNYPIGLIMGEDNTPLIDTSPSRQTRVILDEHIKINDEEAEKIFSDPKNDFELEYALNYIEKL